MTTEKKLLGVNPSGGGDAANAANVANVFSTYLYDGNNSTQTITNGIDLAGEGGMVWMKPRHNVSSSYHCLSDTERGVNKHIYSNATFGEGNSSTLTAFNANGFTVGNDPRTNSSSDNYASWTFRKAPKFFDVVTYTGTDSTHTIPHSLGSAPGMIMVKCTDTSGTNWPVYHKEMAGTEEMYLNNTVAKSSNSRFGTAPTDTVFTVTGSDPDINGNTLTYVAYLFADNTAEDADDQMIKCGSFTGDTVVDLGWEPQFVLYKRTDAAGNWHILDTMRGWDSNRNIERLYPNTSGAEVLAANYHKPTPTGMDFSSLGASETYIYMAIRSPMMVEPEVGTDVFAVDTFGSTGDGKEPAFRSNFPVDMVYRRETGAGLSAQTTTASRLTGHAFLTTSYSTLEVANSYYNTDYNNGWFRHAMTFPTNCSYMWKRAKGFFDVVAYAGTGVTGRTVAHSLGVAPEMIWVKKRDSNAGWIVYETSLGGTKALVLNESDTSLTYTSFWNDTNPTSSVFSLGASINGNSSSGSYVAYLFASLAGISKVGSYTGNGSNQTIDCGFSAGARYILIKRTDATGDWYIWDATRGIVAGNDPHFTLNSSAPEVTSDDSVDPANSGFIVNQVAATNINVSSGTYIFYAIA